MARPKRALPAQEPSSQPSKKSDNRVQQLKAHIDFRFDKLYDLDDPMYLLMGFDFGTSKCVASYSRVKVQDMNPFKIEVERVLFPDRLASFPMLMAVRASFENPNTCADFVIGDLVNRGLQQQIIHPHQVLTNLKQGCYLMDPTDPLFRDRRDALLETQRRHDSVLQQIKAFKEVKLHFPGRGKKVYYPQAGPMQQADRIDNVEDLFVILLSWLLNYSKYRLSELSNIDMNEMDNLFKTEKVRMGVAVPDVLPGSNVTKFHEILCRAGFDDKTQMLSEARCSAVQVAKGLLKQENDEFVSLGRYAQKYVDVYDIGHGTTDIATIRGARGGTTLQFKFGDDPKGNATGGKAIEDHFLKLLSERFDSDLKDFQPRQIDESIPERDEVLEAFRLGIATVKHNFNEGEDILFVGYYGPGSMKVGQVDGGFRIGERCFGFPQRMLRESYDYFLDPIIRLTSDAHGRAGLLKEHYTAINKTNGVNRKDRFVFLVGGPAQAKYTRRQIESALRQISTTATAPVQFYGERDSTYVADGAVLMLSDKELSKRRFHNESLGFVMHSNDSNDGIERVDWLFKIGQQIDERTEFNDRLTYSIEVHPETPTQRRFSYPVSFEWQFARTADEAVGQADYPAADCPEIRRDRGIQYDLDRQMCEFIGVTRNAEGLEMLQFEFNLHVELVGQVVRCKVTIPEGGRFTTENVQTRSFETLMTADLSHLVQEDLFKCEE